MPTNSACFTPGSKRSAHFGPLATASDGCTMVGPAVSWSKELVDSQELQPAPSLSVHFHANCHPPPIMLPWGIQFLPHLLIVISTIWLSASESALTCCCSMTLNMHAKVGNQLLASRVRTKLIYERESVETSWLGRQRVTDREIITCNGGIIPALQQVADGAPHGRRNRWSTPACNKIYPRSGFFLRGGEVAGVGVDTREVAPLVYSPLQQAFSG